MPTYGPKLRKLLTDDTLLRAHDIADLLGVGVDAVKKWYTADPWMERRGYQRRIKLPDPDPADAETVRGGHKAPRWRTSVVVKWAIDPTQTNGRVYLDNNGDPIRRHRKRTD